MAQLDLKVLTDTDWQAVLKKHGNGQVVKRVQFSDCTDENYPGHHVVHGRNTQTGDLTNTGFLRNQNEQVVAGVDAIL
jgi:hypothetical protein